MEIPERLASLVERRADTMSGQLCFRATRIPVAVILDNFRAGYSWEEILENYPSLTTEHLAALKDYEDHLVRLALGIASGE